MCEFSGVVREILLEYVRIENWLCLNRHVHTCFQRSEFSVKVIASILKVDWTRLESHLALESCHHYTVTHASIDQLSVNAWQIEHIIHISQIPVSCFYIHLSPAPAPLPVLPIAIANS